MFVLPIWLYSKNGVLEAITKMMQVVRGSYALVVMTKDELIAVRDPLGIRPLALGKLDNSYVVASESCAFDTIDAEYIRGKYNGYNFTLKKCD